MRRNQAVGLAKKRGSSNSPVKLQPFNAKQKKTRSRRRRFGAANGAVVKQVWEES